MDEDVRLVDGSNPLEGRVEICLNRAWGTICNNSFSISDAADVCRQLRYHFDRSQVIPTSNFSQAYFLMSWNVLEMKTQWKIVEDQLLVYTHVRMPRTLLSDA